MSVETHPWPAPQSSGIQASVVVPGSKSLTNRELLLSALAGSVSRLSNPLDSRDSQLMISALTQLGVKFDWQGNILEVRPGNLIGNANIDCGLAGTVMRFVPPMAALATGLVGFDGDASARKRPMKTTIDSLRALGVEIESATGGLPFSIMGHGAIAGGELTIDASSSSQFVSGLLLSAARFENGLTLHHSGEHLPSMPHIDMTLQCLRDRGVDARQIDSASWRVEPGPIAGMSVQIEPDLSNAGPFLAAAMVAGGKVQIPNWPDVTTQVGALYPELLTQMGATASLEGRTLSITGDGRIHGLEADLSAAGELTPTIAALAALADSPSRLTGIAHLRGHETDRLAALVAEINGLGGDASELADGIEIRPAALRSGLWHTYEDHRMATAGAIIGLRVPGVLVQDITVTSKTMPEFAALWQNMLEAH